MNDSGERLTRAQKFHLDGRNRPAPELCDLGNRVVVRIEEFEKFPFLRRQTTQGAFEQCETPPKVEIELEVRDL